MKQKNKLSLAEGIKQNTPKEELFIFGVCCGIALTIALIFVTTFFHEVFFH